jgi:hypothetical protein
MQITRKNNSVSPQCNDRRYLRHYAPHKGNILANLAGAATKYLRKII